MTYDIKNSQERAVKLMNDIEKACVRRGLNLTIYDGKIGFVDQELGKIVMVWNPDYTGD